MPDAYGRAADVLARDPRPVPAECDDLLTRDSVDVELAVDERLDGADIGLIPLAMRR